MSKDQNSAFRAPELRRYVTSGLAGPITASSADCTVCFTGGAQTELGGYPLATWLIPTFDPTSVQPTTFKIASRGIYHVRFEVQFLSTDVYTLMAGISFEASAGQLSLNPDPTSSTFVATDRNGGGAGVSGGIVCSGIVQVPDRAAGGPTGGIVRCHLSDGSNATPSALAGIILLSAVFDIAYQGDLAGN